MRKLFTLLLAVAASVGTMFAEKVKIGDLYYNLDATSLTAEVTYHLKWDDNNYKGLTTANIPASVTYNSVSYIVTSIGDYAFYACTGLTSVTIPNSVTSIGDYAFCNCTGLTSIEIPNSVTSIAGGAFAGCSGLTSVTIPNSVTSIGGSAFSGCTGLTSPVYNAHVFAFMPKTYSGAYTIPEGIELIAGDAFSDCTGLTSVSIPNSVTSIGNSAFSRCIGLTSITIPDNVSGIGESAFSGCYGLTSVTIPSNVTNIEYHYGSNKDYTSVFYGCTGITSVTWNAKNCNCYYFGSQVESFVFGNEVEVIPNNICEGMNKLTSIIIPDSVTSIGYWAFSGCTGLTSVETPAIFFNKAYNIFNLGNTEMPSHIKHITISSGELTSEGLDRIRVSYRELEMIDLANATNTELPDVALNGCYKLQTLFLPQNLKRIGYMAVADCKNLQSIDIPASVTEISQSAFENCRSLKTITFGGQASSAPGRFGNASSSQLQTIGNWAFYNCHELQNLEIPEGVTYIGDGAFYGCVYLEGLSLPSSVQSIGDNCFALCSKLQKIIVNAPVPPSIQAKTFYDVNRQIPVYVPDESVNAYKNDAQWSEFNIQGISNVPLAIDQINSSSLQGGGKGRLILRDGQVFILRGEKVYTTTGQEVK